MIRFFRKIRQSLLAENKFAKYMLYAAGEIFLVMIGILLAMQVNDWNEGRKRSNIENRLLIQLEEAIGKDIQILEAEILKTDSFIQLAMELDSLLKGPAPAPTEHLYQLLGSIYGYKSILLNRANYEDIKDNGLSIIRNDQLRSALIEVYENLYPKFDQIKDGEWSINQVNRPFYLSNFTSIRFSKYAVPIDLNTLWEDAYFKNLVYYRLITLQSNQRVIYSKTLSELKDLLLAIEKNASSR